jgi:hypothetical protein
MHRSIVLFSLFLVFFVFSQLASAHARWSIAGEDIADSLVAPRTSATGLKEPAPCGGVARTNSPVVLQSGATVEVQFSETINHPGYFRIAFSPAADAGFDQNVLVDNIAEVPATRNYTQTITLPDIECDDCTLQLIQVMTDRDPPTNYYSCADIQLTATGTAPPPGGDMTPPSDVTNFTVTGGDTQAVLSWLNPVSDFSKVLILQDTVSILTAPTDTTNYNVGDMIGSASVIYSGSGATYTAQSLVNGNTYYFKIFAFDSSMNYAAGVEMNVTLAASPGNLAPAVSLISEQSQTVTTRVLQDAGNVIVQVTVTDPNPLDNHSVDWSSTDSRLVDVDLSANNFTFDPSGLAAGNYVVGVEVSDDGVPVQSSTATLIMEVVAPPSTTSSSNSTNAASSGGGSLNIFALLITCLIGFIRRCPV